MTPENKDISKRVAGVILALVVLALLMAAIVGALRGNANDLHGGAPRCTDAIADAGGICWGEPR